MKPINEMIGGRLRTLVQVLPKNAQNQGIGEDGSHVLDWVIWLLDKMDEQPPIKGPAHVVYRDWKP